MKMERSSRLILVEGLPGTGKTTLAQSLAASLQASGCEVDLYLEGDLHPVDLQWTSLLPPDLYDKALDDLRQCWLRSPQFEPWETILSRLRKLSVIERGRVLTAYTKLDFRDVTMWDGVDVFREHEIHDGRVSVTEFCDTYLRRWQRFAGNNDQATFIFECAFFQCIVTELLGHHLADENTILDFLAELIDPVRHMKPEIRYIRAANYADCVRAAGETRPNWLPGVINWVETSPYGQENNLRGFDGMMDFFRRRHEIERSAMDRLGLTTHLIAR